MFKPVNIKENEHGNIVELKGYFKVHNEGVESQVTPINWVLNEIYLFELSKFEPKLAKIIDIGEDDGGLFLEFMFDNFETQIEHCVDIAEFFNKRPKLNEVEQFGSNLILNQLKEDKTNIKNFMFELVRDTDYDNLKVLVKKYGVHLKEILNFLEIPYRYSLNKVVEFFERKYHFVKLVYCDLIINFEVIRFKKGSNNIIKIAGIKYKLSNFVDEGEKKEIIVNLDDHFEREHFDLWGIFLTIVKIAKALPYAEFAIRMNQRLQFCI